MTSAVAPERAFPVYRRGETRDDIMRSFRLGLRARVNPDTGLPFSEREIAAATADLSRWHMEADAVDLVLLAAQQRAIYLANQVRPDRASSAWLTSYHGPLWGEAPLAAAGGSGSVVAPCAFGTVFVGSTTIPDPIAVQATDPAGKTYQVLYTATATVTPFSVQMQAVDTGDATNLAAGAVLVWSQNKPAGAQPSAEVGTYGFSGGLDRESMAEFAARLLALVRHKAASGNDSHMRYWARRASNSVEDAFIFACALHAGTAIVCPTQKRGSTLGPAGRVPSVGTLAAVTGYLVPPGSPVVPKGAHVLVVAPTQQSSDLVLSLSMASGQASGWTDLSPWPEQAAGDPCTVTAVVDQQNFTITRAAGSAGLPAGVTAPALMLWDADTSRWEALVVQSVTAAGGDDFTVVLTSAPTMTVAMGQYVSPAIGREQLTAETIEAYFDSLGPGEVIALATDARGHRAYRFPEPTEEYPQRAGSSVLTWLHDSLGASLADSALESISSTTPIVPVDPTLGPALMVCGHVGVYPL